MSVDFPRESAPSVARPFRFQWEEAQECFVLLYPEGMVKLNDSAAEILKRCQTACSVGDLIAGDPRVEPGQEVTLGEALVGRVLFSLRSLLAPLCS